MKLMQLMTPKKARQIMPVMMMLLIMTLTGFVQAEETSKSKKLNELVDVMDMGAMIESMYSQTEEAMKGMSAQMGIQPTEQPLFDKYYSQMIAILKQEMSWAKMKPHVIGIYDRHFTEQDIDNLLAFYDTDTGKKLLSKMPVVMQESTQISQTLMQGTIPKMQAIAKQLGEELVQARQSSKEESSQKE